MSPNDATDSSDVTRDSSGDGDGEETGVTPLCPANEPSHIVRHASALSSPASIDGDCGEFGTIDPLPIPPPDTLDGAPVNTSDNTADCRAVWRDAAESRVHMCCEVDDESLIANTLPSEDPSEMHGGEDGDDDRVEYQFKCDMDRSSYGCTTKLFINIRSPDPTAFERIYRARNDRDERLAEDFEARANWSSEGYVLEWEANLGFQVDPGQLSLCELAVLDIDSDGSEGEAYVFGAEGTINHISEWGCCQFEPE